MPDCTCTHNNHCLLAQRMILRENDRFKAYIDGGHKIEDFKIYYNRVEMRRNHRDRALRRGPFDESRRTL